MGTYLAALSHVLAAANYSYRSERSPREKRTITCCGKDSLSLMVAITTIDPSKDTTMLRIIGTILVIVIICAVAVGVTVLNALRICI
jgi:hypothetical protein